MLDTTNPLIVQSDRSVLLEVASPRYMPARDILARFAELVKSPEHIHSYRVTPLSLWNAAAAGMSAQEIIGGLREYSKYELPGNVVRDIEDAIGRYGRVKLTRQEDHLLLTSEDAALIAEVARHKRIQPFLLAEVDPHTLLVNPVMRGHIKQALVYVGYPAEDLAGYVAGETLAIRLLPTARSNHAFGLRAYQTDAAGAFHAGGAAHGGSGTIVLPCGAGKTVVGMAVMERLQCSTLILTPSTVAARQWISELLDKTSLTDEEVGEYSGLEKQIRPVTISTYQIMTYRKRTGKKGDAAHRLSGNEEYPHFGLFNARDWGLIIYDEVHLLPAPVFRITAELQARRRLGLTATLVREDGREADVFSLIGPKKYDTPWRDLERQGWIATAVCHEVRIALPARVRMEYAVAEERAKYAIAATSTAKLDVMQHLLHRHRGDNILIIGMYIDQLEQVAASLRAPLITGKTAVREREKLYEGFRRGEFRILVVSKVANFSIDLPDANVAIEISGTFGSRQEEAQRLGRILRPKRDGQTAHFYALVTRDTVDQTFAANRQLFLTEQGYQYEILYDTEIV